MRVMHAFGFVVACGLSLGLGCQYIADLDGTAVFEPATGGMGGAGGNGGAMTITASSNGAGGMSSSSGTGGMGGMGGAPECTDISDCISSECRTATACTNGQCVWTNKPNDAMVASQLYGDCKTRQCDGNGGVKLVDNIDSKDTYDWVNPCYVNSCEAFPNPLAVPDTPLKTCKTPWGNTMGHCSNLKCIDCTTNADCAMPAICDLETNRCVAPECDDGMMNGTETDIDCGGTTCPKCTGGKKCLIDGDCTEKCNMMDMLCTAPTCMDGVLNGDETDMDCGGSCTKANPAKLCDDGAKCVYPADCKSGVCKSGVCADPTCGDQVQNEGELGIDCGIGACEVLPVCPPAP